MSAGGRVQLELDPAAAVSMLTALADAIAICKWRKWTALERPISRRTASGLRPLALLLLRALEDSGAGSDYAIAHFAALFKLKASKGAR